jgi:hypothetical protein
MNVFQTAAADGIVVLAETVAWKLLTICHAS